MRPRVVRRRRNKQFVGCVALELNAQPVQSETEVKYRRGVLGVVGGVCVIGARLDIDSQSESVLVRSHEDLNKKVGEDVERAHVQRSEKGGSRRFRKRQSQSVAVQFFEEHSEIEVYRSARSVDISGIALCVRRSRRLRPAGAEQIAQGAQIEFLFTENGLDYFLYHEPRSVEVAEIEIEIGAVQIRTRDNVIMVVVDPPYRQLRA